jgi:hypothetical protein
MSKPLPKNDVVEPDAGNIPDGLIPECLSLGFKAVLLKGYEQHANPDHNEDQALMPLDGSHADPEFKGLSLPEIEEAERVGYGIGWRVPEGIIALGSEDPAVLAQLGNIFDGDWETHSILKSSIGKQYFFRCNGNDMSEGSEYICAGGFPVNARVAGKGYLILPPSNGLVWESRWEPGTPVPELFWMLKPHDPDDKRHIARCLSWSVGEAKACYMT